MSAGHARIVFADGSKALAHNTDDLYGRWRMRRSDDDADWRERPFTPTEQEREFVPSVNAPKTFSQAYEQRALMFEREQVLSQHIAALRREQIERRITHDEYTLLTTTARTLLIKANHQRNRAEKWLTKATGHQNVWRAAIIEREKHR